MKKVFLPSAIFFLFFASCSSVDVDQVQNADVSVNSSSADVSSSSSANPESSDMKTDISSSSKTAAFKCGTNFEDSKSGTSYATVRIKTQC